MEAVCPKCGATTKVTITGKSRWKMDMGSEMMRTCHAIRERLAKDGTTSNFDCDTLTQAAGRVVDEFRRRRR